MKAISRGILHITDCDEGGVPVVIDTIMTYIPGSVGFLASVPLNFVNATCVDFSSLGPRSINPLTSSKIYIDLLKKVSKVNPRVIHGHSAFGGLYGALVSKQLNIPFIYTPHASPNMIPKRPLSKRILGSLEWISCKIAKTVIACSEDEAAAISELCPSANIDIVPNGIEPCLDVRALERPCLWDIINVGRICEQKRPDIFIELAESIAARSPGVRIAWLGDGEPLCSTSVNWLGPKAEAEVVSALNRSRIFLTTSDYEGLSLAALRAAAAGCELVMRNTAGTRSPVFLGAKGSLYSANEDAIELLMGLLEKPHCVEDRFSRAKVSENLFSSDKFIKRMEDIYYKYL